MKKIKYIMMGVSFLIIIIGFVLMTGVKTGATFNEEIYAARYITVGPMISFFGFLMMIFAILYHPKQKK